MFEIERGAMMFAAAMAGILVTMVLALVRAGLGPTIVDRILALNMLAQTILLISVTGFYLAPIGSILPWFMAL